MTHRTRRAVLGIFLAALTIGPLGSVSAQEPTLVPATEELFISAACVGTPTCTSTRWLGKTKGDATSNFLTSTTPVDEALYRVDGSLNWRDYGSDDSLRAGGYPLNASEKIVSTVRVQTSNPGVAALCTVHSRIEALIDGQTVTFGPLEATQNILPNGFADYRFEFEVPDDLEGKVLQSLTSWVATHGVNAQGGYINQAGASTVKIPYYETAV